MCVCVRVCVLVGFSLQLLPERVCVYVRVCVSSKNSLRRHARVCMRVCEYECVLCVFACVYMCGGWGMRGDAGSYARLNEGANELMLQAARCSVVSCNGDVAC